VSSKILTRAGAPVDELVPYNVYQDIKEYVAAKCPLDTRNNFF
jgi:hypothetical protein